MNTVMLSRDRMGLFPADAHSEEVLMSIPHGKIVKAEIRQPRNGKHHRQFFALISEIFNHQSVYPTLPSLLDAIKLWVGHVDYVRTLDGATIPKPKSISYSKQDEIAFGQFSQKVVELILTELLPLVNKEELKTKIFEILDGKGAYNV